jgi:hypothetical protein
MGFSGCFYSFGISFYLESPNASFMTEFMTYPKESIKLGSLGGSSFLAMTSGRIEDAVKVVFWATSSFFGVTTGFASALASCCKSGHANDAASTTA